MSNHLRNESFYMKAILLLIGLLMSNILLCQKISGKLIDSNTQEPISFAHIYSEDPKLGTISNDKGEFNLMIAEGNDGIRLVISHIGYKGIKLAVKQDTSFTLQMIPDVVTLEEFTIDASAKDLARTIFEDLKSSQMEKKFGKAFYRQLSMKDTFATEWVEAFYDISYSTAGLNELAIDQARVAESKSRDKNDLHLSSINFGYLTGIAIYSESQGGIASPFSASYFEDYNFQIVEKLKKSDDILVKVSFSPSPGLTAPIRAYGSFIYNISQKAMMSINLFFDSSLGVQVNQIQNGMRVEIQNPHHAIEFQFGTVTKNLFEKITVSFSYDLFIEDKSYPCIVKSTLFVYQIDSNRHKKLFKPNPQFDFFNAFVGAKYKPRFWKDNPVIKLTKEEEAIIASFEKDNAFGSYFKGKKE
jgi:hypothetical protein